MKENLQGFYRFCTGVSVGYFLIYPAVHGNYSHRYDDIKNLFSDKKVTNKTIDNKKQFQELDNLTLETFKDKYGNDIGLEKYTFYKNNNNYSNQLNPNNDSYWKSKGYSSQKDGSSDNSNVNQSNLDNRSNQLNPNNDAYYQSRGSDNSNESSNSQSDNDNHSNQMNPNNDAYSSSRGK